MPNRRKKSSSNYRIRIRGVRRRHPDASKIARAVIDLALAQAAREATAQAEATAAADRSARALGRTAIRAHQLDAKTREEAA